MIRKNAGFSLVEIMVASGIVLIVVLAVGLFMANQSVQTLKVEGGSACRGAVQNMAQSFTKDDNSLFITSYGSDYGSTRYPVNIEQTPERLDRFTFPDAYNFIDPGTNGFVVAPFNTPVPLAPATDMQFHNSLNLRNSVSRFVAIANNYRGSCCTGADLSTCVGGVSLKTLWSLNQPSPWPTPGPGVPWEIVWFSKFFPSGTDFTNIDAVIKLQLIQNGVNMCNTAAGTPILLTPGTNTFARFRIELTVPIRGVASGAGTPPPTQTCVAEGRANFSLNDNAVPLTVVDLQSGSLCDSAGPNTFCGTSSGDTWAVTLDAYTAADDLNCRACVAAATRKLSCTTQSVSAPSTCFASGACQASDPGSAFLCRFGEKSYIASGNANGSWEPCAAAKVYDCDGTDLGATVTVNFVPFYMYGGNDRLWETDPPTPSPPPTSTTRLKYTRANIVVSNLPTDRVYQFDVRAVDSAALMAGPSFCSINDAQCDVTSGTGLAVSSSNFTMSNLVPLGNAVASSIAPPMFGTVTSVLAQSQFNGLYQCSRGSAAFSSNITGMACGGGLGNYTCTGSFVQGTGSIDQCTCDANSVCTLIGTPALDGIHQMEMVVTDQCGHTDSRLTSAWCTDSDETFQPVVRDYGYFPSSGPTFVATFAPAKVCGTVYLCPNAAISGTWKPGLNQCLPANMDWDVNTMSGCTDALGWPYPPPALPMFTGTKPLYNASANPQVGFEVIDACGRVRNTKPSGAPLHAAFGVVAPTQSCSGPGVCVFGGTRECSLRTGSICGPLDYCANSGVGYYCISQGMCPTAGQPCYDGTLASPPAGVLNSCANAWDCPLAGDPNSADRCSTTYKCVNGAYTATPGGCTQAGAGSCTIPGVCPGGAMGTCTGNPGFQCRNDAECGAMGWGTCIGAISSNCLPSQNGLSGPCYSSADCNLTGDCDIDVQGQCICPSNRFCDSGAPTNFCGSLQLFNVFPTPTATPVPSATPTAPPSTASPTPTPTPPCLASGTMLTDAYCSCNPGGCSAGPSCASTCELALTAPPDYTYSNPFMLFKIRPPAQIPGSRTYCCNGGIVQLRSPEGVTPCFFGIGMEGRHAVWECQ